jgi:hypothetical protein
MAIVLAFPGWLEEYLPPQAAEALSGLFSSVRQKSTAYKAPGAEISLDP